MPYFHQHQSLYPPLLFPYCLCDLYITNIHLAIIVLYFTILLYLRQQRKRTSPAEEDPDLLSCTPALILYIIPRWVVGVMFAINDILFYSILLYWWYSNTYKIPLILCLNFWTCCWHRPPDPKWIRPIPEPWSVPDLLWLVVEKNFTVGSYQRADSGTTYPLAFTRRDDPLDQSTALFLIGNDVGRFTSIRTCNNAIQIFFSEN